MAKKTVNVGVSANDNTGDYLRPAMIKINENFSELYDFNDSLSTVAFSGNYDDLNNRPFFLEFDGDYNSLENLPTLGTASAENTDFFALAAQAVPPGGTTGQVLTKTSDTDNDVEWAAGGGGGGITELSEDLSPQLGADLDLNGFNITGMVIGADIQPYSSVLANTTASFLTADETKLDALPDNASLQSSLNAKAPLASPTFTGDVIVPDQTVGNNSTKAANTKYVDASVTAGIATLTTGAPTGLNTLDKIAAAINDDASYNTTITSALALKAPLASPTFTGTPVAPTATAGTNTTQIATTAFVTTANAGKADLASPTFTGTPLAPTAALGTNTTQIATTAFVKNEINDVAITFDTEPTELSIGLVDETGLVESWVPLDTTPVPPLTFVVTNDADPAEIDFLTQSEMLERLSSASSSFLLGTLEVGDTADTTISRSSAGVIAVEGVNLTPNIPQNSKSADYTLVIGDANTHIYHPVSDDNARTFTIPANASVAFPIGTFITFINDQNTVNIAITTDTLVLAGTGTTGTRTLAENGVATAIKVTSTRWVISGAGLT